MEPSESSDGSGDHTAVRTVVSCQSCRAKTGTVSNGLSGALCRHSLTQTLAPDNELTPDGAGEHPGSLGKHVSPCDLAQVNNASKAKRAQIGDTSAFGLVALKLKGLSFFFFNF